MFSLFNIFSFKSVLIPVAACACVWGGDYRLWNWFFVGNWVKSWHCSVKRLVKFIGDTYSLLIKWEGHHTCTTSLLFITRSACSILWWWSSNIWSYCKCPIPFFGVKCLKKEEKMFIKMRLSLGHLATRKICC